MAKFCNKCGTPLTEGQECPNCSTASVINDENGRKITNKNVVGERYSKGDPYEKSRKIVPDCVIPDEGEIPLRQYDVALLRSRIILHKAFGKLMVTNKRVLFRAAGRAFCGDTLLQYEFDINEIGGIEGRYDYKFSLMSLFIASLIPSISLFLTSFIMSKIESEGLIILLAFILQTIHILLFFMRKNKLKTNLFVGGAAYGFAVGRSSVLYNMTDSLGGKALLVLASINAMIMFIECYKISFVPNFILTFKTKGGHNGVEIRPKKYDGQGLFGFLAFIRLPIFTNTTEFTGFDEILPGRDADRALNEVPAMINDLRTVGDMAIEKWKQ